jgi:extradiol dioxygenase family protein
MIDAQRVDFIAVPVQDRDRAARFYEETLGFTRNPNSTETWIEFETERNGLAVHHRYAPYPDGTMP